MLKKAKTLLKSKESILLHPGNCDRLLWNASYFRVYRSCLIWYKMDAAIVGSQRDFLNKKRKNTVLFIVNKFTVFAWLILMSELVGKIAPKKNTKKKHAQERR